MKFNNLQTFVNYNLNSTTLFWQSLQLYKLRLFKLNIRGIKSGSLSDIILAININLSTGWRYKSLSLFNLIYEYSTKKTYIYALSLWLHKQVWRNAKFLRRISAASWKIFHLNRRCIYTFISNHSNHYI